MGRLSDDGDAIIFHRRFLQAAQRLCNDTSLYKCTDNRMVYIEHIPAGAAFPNFPGGTGKSKTTWYKVTKASDGDQKSFKSAMVEAGTL